VVRLQGPRPTLPPIPTNDSVARACGTSIPDRSLQLARDGGLIDAVVWVDAPATPAPAGSLPVLKVDQSHCDYSPHVLAAFTGQRLALVNSDPLVHSIHGAQNGRALFNFAQPVTGMRAERALPRTPGLVELRCELHPWMHAYVKVFDHPYFALTDRAGRFRIADVRPGPHTLTVWQPRLGTRTVAVEVAPGMAPLTVSWRPEGAL
jgi:hypothetical protein